VPFNTLIGKKVKGNSKTFLQSLRTNYWLYLLLLPGLVYLFIFNYIPMGGIVIAFQDFRITRGFLGSDWVGLRHFRYLFDSPVFFRVLRNSLWLSFLRMVWGFPMPIILAVMMNEMLKHKYKRFMQTVLYLPHFISWVIVFGIVQNFLSPSTGIINLLIMQGGGTPVHFFTNPSLFRPMIVLTDIWKNAGWGTIIYMAAISGIDAEMYEAAIIDGASRFQRIRFITIPAISGTIVVMLVLRLGGIMANGFEQLFLFQNALTLGVGEVFETYTYRVGLLEGRFSFAAAVGIFNSAVSFIMLFSTNFIARRIKGGGLW